MSLPRTLIHQSLLQIYCILDLGLIFDWFGDWVAAERKEFLLNIEFLFWPICCSSHVLWVAKISHNGWRQVDIGSLMQAYWLMTEIELFMRDERKWRIFFHFVWISSNNIYMPEFSVTTKRFGYVWCKGHSYWLIIIISVS